MKDQPKRLLATRFLIGHFVCSIVFVFIVWLMEWYPRYRHTIHAFRSLTDAFVGVFGAVVIFMWCLTTISSFLVIAFTKKAWLFIPLIVQLMLLICFIAGAAELNNSTSVRLLQFCICFSGLSTVVSLWPIKVLSKEIPRRGIKIMGCGEQHGAPVEAEGPASVCKEDENVDSLSSPDSFIIIKSEKEAVRKS